MGVLSLCTDAFVIFYEYLCITPIRVETGRYEHLLFAECMCPLCNGGIENELHVLTSRPIYNDLRNQIYTKAREQSENFDNLPDEQKMYFL